MPSRGSVAQLVERSTENRKVTGSTPVGATAKGLEPTRFRAFALPRRLPAAPSLAPSSRSVEFRVEIGPVPDVGAGRGVKIVEEGARGECEPLKVAPSR